MESKRGVKRSHPRRKNSRSNKDQTQLDTEGYKKGFETQILLSGNKSIFLSINRNSQCSKNVFQSQGFSYFLSQPWWWASQLDEQQTCHPIIRSSGWSQKWVEEGKDQFLSPSSPPCQGLWSLPQGRACIFSPRSKRLDICQIREMSASGEVLKVEKHRA